MNARAASKRHAGTNAAKRLAYDLFERHRSEYGSLEALAEAITGKIEAEARKSGGAEHEDRASQEAGASLQPVAYRTVRKWLTEFGQPGYVLDK